MFRTRWCLLTLALCLLWTLPGLADGGLMLPASLTTVEDAAFEGDSSITSVTIPANVQSIGSRAFANCSQLTTVRFESKTTFISDDAFDGSPVVFEAYAGSTAETYGYAHTGIDVSLIDGGNFNDLALSLVMARGKPESAAHGELYASERLLVQMNSSITPLPDISAYSPNRILSEGTGYYVLQFDDMDQASACHAYLNSAEGVSIVEPDKFMTAVASGEVSAASLNENWEDSDPMRMSIYANYLMTKYPNAHATVAVIDSGVASHSALNAHVRSGYDFTGQNNPRYDATGHGTSVAGCIVDAVYEANVDIIPIRVFGMDFVTTSMLRQAIQKAIAIKPSVINISYGFDESAILTALLQHSNVPIVVSAGNSNANCNNLFPAKLPNVITVSAITTTMQRWNDSNYGTCINYCAPGDDIAGYTSAGGTYNYYKGTSYAAPQISAAIALLAMDPEHGMTDLQNSCRDLGAPGYDQYYGWGLPNMAMLTGKVAEIRITTDIPTVMQVGGSGVLLYEVLPSDAEDKTVTIQSSDSAVLNVTKTAEGVLRLVGLSQGTAGVTITANDGSGVSVSTGDIQVIQPVTRITLTAPTNEVNLAIEGETLGIIATIQPTDATNKELEWTSSDPTKATVAQNGVVTPLAVNDLDENGQPIPVTIRATAKDKFGAYGEFDVYVINMIIPTAIGIEKDSSEMTVGQTKSLNGIVEPEGAVDTFTWYSTDSTVASVSNGIVTANKSGRVYIVVTSTVAPDIQASCELIITQPPTNVTLTTPSEFTGILDVGASLQLSASVVPVDADDIGIIWSSSDENIAYVDATGKVTGRTPGFVTIKAAAHGNPSIFKSVAVTVRQTPTSINLSGDSFVYVGTTKTLTATVLPTDAYDKRVTWTSSDTAVATVDGTGKVNGLARGTTVITATSVAVPTLSATMTIEIYPEWTYYDWALASEIPENAIITDRKWTYTEFKTTDNASESGWTQTGTRWTQTGSGSKQYASFPSTYNTSHWTYTQLNGSAYTASETTTNKRTVSNSHAGWIYWHWAYDAAYGNRTDRWISDRHQTAGSSRNLPNYAYQYFYAFTSTTDAPALSGFTYTWGANAKYDSSKQTYNCANCLPSGANTGSTSGLNNPRFLRIEYFNSSYIDYKKQYDYKRDVTTTTQPTPGPNITNIVEWVKYKVANNSSIQISGWVSESSVPSGAEIMETKWTYKETITSNAASMSGWTQESSAWQQSGSGSVRWVDFSPISGFDRSNSLYAAYNTTAPTAYENTTAKRTINGTSNDGYIFWHWMYDCGGGNNGDRAIFYQKGYGSNTLTGNSYGYKYFGAFEDTQSGTQMGANTNWGQNDTYYLWYTVSGHSGGYSQNQGSKYWYRTQIKKTTYIDYTKLFTYSRTVTTTTQPTAGNGISNITKMVRYIIK